MSNSIFCPNCGMLKSNCTCGHSNNEVSSSNGDSVDLFSFQKPISSSILDDEIPEVYSIEDHRLDEDTVSYLQGKYPHIETDIIENFLKARGCTTQRCGNNVWTIAPGYSHERPTLLLNSHIDTVRPVDGWTCNPFSPDDDGERIYGLGSNDAGASVVSLTAAFLLLSQRQQRYNLVFLASCEE